MIGFPDNQISQMKKICLLYTSDAADERSSVDLGGRRIIKKKKIQETSAVNDKKIKKQTLMTR